MGVEQPNKEEIAPVSIATLIGITHCVLEKVIDVIE